MSEKEDDKQLSPWVRVPVAVLLLALALTHLLFPSLPIDTTFLGLLAMAGLLIFFDLHEVQIFGTTFKKQKRQVEKAKRLTESTVIPDAEPTTPEPPQPKRGPAAATEEPAHKEAFDLWPPTEPPEALLWAAEQIRIELIVLMGNSGTEIPRKPFSLYHSKQLVRFLTQKEYLPGGLLEPVETVVDRRNELAHGVKLPSRVLEASAELAYDVLVKLKRVKRNYYRVRMGSIKVYQDRSLTSPLDAPAFMLVSLSNEGEMQHIGVYPRITSYTTGRFVTWEWSFEPSYTEEAWYQDPETGQPKIAWNSAASFAGREYPEQWGLEYRLPRPDMGLLETQLP